jgi:hypothetical protein
MKDPSKLTYEIVKLSYEEIIRKGIPFLQVFPQMFQESNISSTITISIQPMMSMLYFLSMIMT